MKKVIATLLATLMLSTGMTSNAVADKKEKKYKDMDQHWSKQAVEQWSGRDVINGFADDSFKPDETLTRAQLATLITKLLGLKGSADLSSYKDLDKNAWYYDSIATCVEAGILTGYGDEKMGPNDFVTREQTMTIYCRALGIEPAPMSERDFPDSDKTSDWAKGYVNAMTNLGYVNGMGGGQLSPEIDISRGSAVTLLGNVVTVYATEPGSYNVDKGIALIKSDNVILSGKAESVVISQAADNARVEISNVTTNKLKIEAKQATIVVSDQSNIKDVAMETKANNTTLTLQTGTVTTNVKMQASQSELIVEGQAKNINVDTSDKPEETPAIIVKTGANIQMVTITEKAMANLVFEAGVKTDSVPVQNNNTVEEVVYVKLEEYVKPTQAPTTTVATTSTTTAATNTTGTTTETTTSTSNTTGTTTATTSTTNATGTTTTSATTTTTTRATTTKAPTSAPTQGQTDSGTVSGSYAKIYNLTITLRDTANPARFVTAQKTYLTAKSSLLAEIYSLVGTNRSEFSNIVVDETSRLILAEGLEAYQNSQEWETWVTQYSDAVVDSSTGSILKNALLRNSTLDSLKTGIVYQLTYGTYTLDLVVTKD